MPKPLDLVACILTEPHKGHKYFHDRDLWCPGISQGNGQPLFPILAEKAEVTTRDAAEDFLRECGLEPTWDAIGQLAEVFLPCLKIMCERGYDPDGATWRAEGWRGMVWKARDKMERLWWFAWTRGENHPDSVFDGINYLGFFLRARLAGGDGWGKRGAPGNVEAPQD